MSNNVIDLQEYHVRFSLEERNRRNKLFTERLLSRWSAGGSTSGYALFLALLHKAMNGPVATPERARAILPTVLDVLDEMNEAELQAAFDAAIRNQPA
jgi:hypothetical protein